MAIEEPTGNLEREIAEIEHELATKKEQLKSDHEGGQIEAVPHEKEILKEVIGNKFNNVTSQTPTSSSSASDDDPPSYLSEELSQAVGQLSEIASEKGLDEAIRTAKSTNNAALIDAFHDILSDQLYNKLVDEGKIDRFPE